MNIFLVRSLVGRAGRAALALTLLTGCGLPLARAQTTPLDTLLPRRRSAEPTRAETLPTGPLSGSGQRIVHGYLREAGTREALVGATVYEPRSGRGAVTNVQGFFSLSLAAGPGDTAIVRLSATGRVPLFVTLLPGQGAAGLWEVLLPSSEGLQQEVIIEANRSGTPRIDEQIALGSITVPIEQIRATPAALGEPDLLRVLQLIPGVKMGSEGSTGLYVRGGSPDQNLYLLDGVPLYNVSHLGGLFSIFNTDALNHVELLKGGFPARYGGRLSSVLEIRMREGNPERLHGAISVGIISSRFALEGPLVKGRTTFSIAARRTYLDLFSRPLSRLASGGEVSVGYNFYDLNAKVTHRLGPRDRLSLSAYAGDDRFYALSRTSYVGPDNENIRTRGRAGFAWGNLLLALRHEHVYSERLFHNLTVYGSRYRFVVSNEQTTTGGPNPTSERFAFRSGIGDLAARLDYDYFAAPDHTVRFGAHLTDHLFTPGINQIRSSGSTLPLDTSFGSRRQRSFEGALYIEDEWRITPRLGVNVGLHGTAFRAGARTYGSVQPRLAGRYKLEGGRALKVGVVQMQQFLHLLSNSDAGLPTDLWVPATARVGPQTSWLYTAGIAQHLDQVLGGPLELSVEGYYRQMRGLVEYREGTDFLGSAQDWETRVATGGRGTTYGVEFLAHRKAGRLSGWVGYTLAWATRQFDSLNLGRPYPFRYDRRHDIGAMVIYRVGDWFDASASFMYGTGNAFTFGRYRYPSLSDGNLMPNLWFDNHVTEYGGRNSFRMRAFHKLDLSLNFHKQKRWGVRTWTLSVYNAYSRQNPFFYYVGTPRNPPTPDARVVKQVSLFPIIPMISYAYRF